jgi:hypothetical protein
MLDENLIATLEQSLRQTRNVQSRLLTRLSELQAESGRLREEIEALENHALQTESAIDSLLVTMRSSNRGYGSGATKLSIDDEFEIDPKPRSKRPVNKQKDRSGKTVAFPNRSVPARSNLIEPISNRFADRTITQACTLLLREAGKPLHVNELYNLLVSGGMRFKGTNPTISIAVSLNRNRRFRKVEPGTFDLMFREASQQAAS